MRAAPAAKHGGKALPFGSRAQRRCGLAAGAGGRAGLTAGHSAGVALRRGVCTGVALQPGQATEPALRRGVCAGRFFGDPKMPHGRRQSMAGKRSLSAAGHSADVALRPGQAAEPALRPGTAQGWPCGGAFAQVWPCSRGRRQSRPYGGAFARGAFSAIPKCRMAGGKAWRESAPFRQPGTAQGWPCSRAQRRGGLARECLHGSVCAGRFSAIPKCRMAGGKAWRESAPFRQPGTAQGWPCSRAQRRGGLARECLHGSVCAGRFSAIPKCRMAGGVVFTFQRGCPGGSARRALFAAGAVSGARCMGSDRLPPGRVQKAGHRENSRRPAKQKP